MGCIDFLKLLVRTRNKDLAEEDTLFNRCLTVLDVILLGTGSMLGPGLYVATGNIARNTAGPAIVISLSIAALPAILSSQCYAEFSSRISKTGSSYVYTYMALGEIWAFIIGWNLILEYILACALLGNEFSRYLDSICGNRIYTFLRAHLADWSVSGFRPFPDFVAFAFIIIFTILAATGPRKPALFIRAATLINFLVILFVVLSGFYLLDLSNWGSLDKFAPYGFDGIMEGASLSYFAFLGFDIINASGEETANPRRSVSFANCVSTYAGVFIYLITAGILTLVIPYSKLSVTTPLPTAFEYAGFTVGKYFVAIGGIFGFSIALLTFMFAGTRIIYAMANDGLLFQSLAKISYKTRTPLCAGLICGLTSACTALFLELHDLVEMLSIGTLMAYTAVPLALLLERYSPLDDSLRRQATSEEDDTSEEKHTTCYGRQTGTNKLEDASTETAVCSIFGDKPSKETHRLAAVAAACLLFATYGFCLTVAPKDGFFLLVIGNPFIVFASCLTGVIAVSTLVILLLLPTKKPQGFHAVPCFPFVPIASILTNIYLLANLSHWTWARFSAWLFIGEYTSFFIPNINRFIFP